MRAMSGSGLNRRQAMGLLVPLLTPMGVLGNQVSRPLPCDDHDGFGTWVSGGSEIEFGYMLDGVVRKLHLDLPAGEVARARVTWRRRPGEDPEIKGTWQTRKSSTRFSPVTARQAIELAKRKLGGKLVRGYEEPEEYYVMIHEDPNIATLIRPLARALKEACGVYGKLGESVDPVRNVLSFVQSLPHECHRKVGARWPTESLLDSGADCDDKTVLACALLNQTMPEYEDPPPPWAMVSYPGHLTLGVNARFCQAWPTWKSGAAHFESGGETFVYVEMNAGPDTEVGWLPPGYEARDATIWPHPDLVRFPAGCERLINGRRHYTTALCQRRWTPARS